MIGDNHFKKKVFKSKSDKPHWKLFFISPPPTDFLLFIGYFVHCSPNNFLLHIKVSSMYFFHNCIQIEFARTNLIMKMKILLILLNWRSCFCNIADELPLRLSVWTSYIIRILMGIWENC